MITPAGRHTLVSSSGSAARPAVQQFGGYLEFGLHHCRTVLAQSALSGHVREKSTGQDFHVSVCPLKLRFGVALNFICCFSTYPLLLSQTDRSTVGHPMAQRSVHIARHVPASATAAAARSVSAALRMLQRSAVRDAGVRSARSAVGAQLSQSCVLSAGAALDGFGWIGSFCRRTQIERGAMCTHMQTIYIHI